MARGIMEPWGRTRLVDRDDVAQMWGPRLGESAAAKCLSEY